MKNTISFLTVCFALFLLNTSVTWGKYKCETGGYEGLDPFNKDQIQNKSTDWENQFYDELAFYRRGLNLIMMNFINHLRFLNEDKKMNLCKCIYTAMTTESDFANSGDEVITTSSYNMDVEKTAPNKMTLTRNVTVTELKCTVNGLTFLICEGYTPRFCIRCYDIWVMVPYQKEIKVPEQVYTKPKPNANNWHSLVIGKVNKVRFGNLL